MLVALDSNVVDLVELACCSHEHVDAIEAMAPPPPFEGLAPDLEVEVFACYWLLALAPAWRSTVYTFSDLVYEELSRAVRARPLLRIAFDVLVREQQEPQYRFPDPRKRPQIDELTEIGVKEADAVHVADAIGIGCNRFLTNDRQLRNRSDNVEKRWHLRIRRPSEFLIEAVEAGAPWTTMAPWPWQSINRIRAGSPLNRAAADPGGL